jgi:hypothetical protein
VLRIALLFAHSFPDAWSRKGQRGEFLTTTVNNSFAKQGAPVLVLTRNPKLAGGRPAENGLNRDTKPCSGLRGRQQQTEASRAGHRIESVEIRVQDGMGCGGTAAMTGTLQVPMFRRTMKEI